MEMCTELTSCWNVYNSIQDLIKFADLKAGVIITAYALFGGALLTKLLDCHGLFNSHIIFIFLLLTAIFSGISLFFAIRCIVPRKYSSDPHSMIFYNNIIKTYPNGNRYAVEFQKKFSTEFQALSDVSNQIYILSLIATEKYKDVTLSSYAFIFSIITVMIPLMIIIA